MSKEWRKSAACRTAPKDLFFPVGKSGKIPMEHLERAFAYCDECPVADECFEFGRRDRERSGIWGGVVFEPGTKRNRRVRAVQLNRPQAG